MLLVVFSNQLILVYLFAKIGIILLLYCRQLKILCHGDYVSEAIDWPSRIILYHLGLHFNSCYVMHVLLLMRA